MFVNRATPALLAAALCLTPVAAAVLPVTAVAQQTQREVAADQAFPFLSKFLALPMSERDEITIAYVLKIKGGTQGASIVLKHNGQSQKLNIAGDGRITPLPTLTQLRGGRIVLTGPEKGVSMRVRVFATETPAKTMSVAPLAKAVQQADTAMRKVGGVLALTQPKPDRLYFVGSGNARVTLADGSQKALPKSPRDDAYPGGTPYLAPAEYPGAVSITFDAVPSRIGIDNQVK
ncbi:hypothetical protein [Asticcacaulis sp. AND118]|uniref:hypothetical protein n=1 Tax=Asticcacaulis sp. AND118 TaxID=2840468 RepID=UPI001CFFB94C|nr:hypothetical protein [Asticcacaulis sp. AND118]UDF04951.1 hypothetical protein LH365_16270 [Asticcacaulis sp. AND118]